MPNALQHETSPYLLQHADNPVDWMPWNDAALTHARRENKPILLSIGYSACHWCHVMAHESFEDEETAALMNALYVNIKVDREERPDLDRIYQLSQQLFTGRAGGWPLTVFLTPEEQWPIFAGTYFPRESAYGMPAFRDVLVRVDAFFRNHRTEIDATAHRLLDALEQTRPTGDASAEPNASLRKSARARLGQSFDATHGGFGSAPKFPHPAEIGFLLTLPDDGARLMAVNSLSAMATGGLFDHLGGGFFRYCVDRDWRIPHFEKMLYDNAALLGCLSEAWARTGDGMFRAAAGATADWLLREMRDPGGGFYATLDADSEGEEGRFYTFVREDFDAVLNAEESAAAQSYFGLDEPPNFEDRAWHLQPRAGARPFGDAGAAVESARRRLLALRDTRVRPGRDEKILASWNGLLIANLARAARLLDRPDLGNAATEAVDFIRANLWRGGRLMAVFKDGQARFPAYLDDHALLAAGLIELLQWEFRVVDLEFAVALADAMLERFADPDGGFFFTSQDHERLIHRPKPLADEALPSGNGQAALALDALGHLLGESRYLEASSRTVGAALPAIERHPEAHASLLRAIERRLKPPDLVIVRGSEAEFPRWRPVVADYAPHRLSFFIPDTAGALPGMLGSFPANGRATAWLCSGTQCSAPLDAPEALQAALAGAELSGLPENRRSRD